MTPWSEDVRKVIEQQKTLTAYLEQSQRIAAMFDTLLREIPGGDQGGDWDQRFRNAQKWVIENRRPGRG